MGIMISAVIEVGLAVSIVIRSISPQLRVS